MKFWHLTKTPEMKKRRADIKAENNLGVKAYSMSNEKQVFRNKKLDVLDKYYDCIQYDHLEPWEQKKSSSGKLIQLHEKKPKINFAFAKTLSGRVASKIIGRSVFPEFTVADSPDDTEFIKSVLRESKLHRALVEPMKRLINSGSIFIKFKITEGVFDIKYYDAKFCYPEFQANGELEKVTYKYVYDDPVDKKPDGSPVRRWKKIEFGMMSEILYDNPEYDPQSELDPVFVEVDRVDHDLGFVQGEWFRTSEIKDSPDGYGIIEDILEFIDELNYSLSQSSRAISYNQDPQLLVSNLEEDAVSDLIRSVTKVWNMGRDGKAEFLESDLNGVKEASALRDKVKGHISDVARIALLDPEKMVASAQSARAMEVLMGPLVDLVDEIRTIVESHFKSLVSKMALTVLIAHKQNMEIPIQIPPGWVPESLAIEIIWPPIFKMTVADWKELIGASIQASNANIISRKTATKKVKEFFDIVDIDAEHAEIAAQPVFNPFGAF